VVDAQGPCLVPQKGRRSTLHSDHVASRRFIITTAAQNALFSAPLPCWSGQQNTSFQKQSLKHSPHYLNHRTRISLAGFVTLKIHSDFRLLSKLKETWWFNSSWLLTPCFWVNNLWCFEGSYCPDLQGEAVQKWDLQSWAKTEIFFTISPKYLRFLSNWRILLRIADVVWRSCAETRVQFNRKTFCVVDIRRNSHFSWILQFFIFPTNSVCVNGVYALGSPS
jgi:hypothetical protein